MMGLQKGLTIYTLKTLIDLLSYLKTPKGSLKKILFSNLQFTGAIAGLSTLYQYLKCKLRGRINQKYIPGIAGSVASLMLLIDRNHKRTATISQLAVVRTLYFLLRAYVYKADPLDKSKPCENTKVRESTNKLERFIRSMIHKYGHFIVWVYASYKVCYTSFVTPNYLTKSFYRTLLWTTNSFQSFGRNAEMYVRGISRLCNALSSVNDHRTTNRNERISESSLDHYMKLKSSAKGELLESLNQVHEIQQFLDPSAHHDFLGCAVQHPAFENCTGAAMDRFKGISKSTYQTYLIVNLIPFVYNLLTSYWKQKQVDVLGKLKHVIVSSIRTCVMTSAYVGLFEMLICTQRKWNGRETSLQYFYLTRYGVAGLLVAPVIVIDKPSRLPELNSYLVSKILESFLLQFYQNGIMRYNRWIEALVMVPTLGALATVAEFYPFALTGITKPVWALVLLLPLISNIHSPMITVFYFASVKQKTKTPKEEFDYSSVALKELVQSIKQKYQLETQLLISVNEEYCNVEDGLVVKDGDVVGLFEPVSGG